MHAHFEKLRQNLEPNPTFDGVIQTRHASVRAQLAPRSHLIGSLQRKTRIQPLPDQTFDIDIVVVLEDFVGWAPMGGSGTTPQTAIQVVLDRVHDSDRYALKNPIVDAPTVTLHFANNVKVELVPAFFDRVGYNPAGIPHMPKDRAYWIPDGAGNWLLADYDYDADYISAANKNESAGYLVPTIKILKAIKRRHFPQLKSFALEMLAAAKIPALVSMHKVKGWPITYPMLLRGFFQLAQRDLLQPISIRGSLSAPIVLSAIEVATIGRQFELICNAIDEMEPKSDADKIKYWRAIIGDEFPATV
jgi:hypothetical protein